ncbi:flagellar assembly protein FliW [Garciella nitratireducens]|uniref:Flagellar assembly factor FliW n=1 Tax=Garciella nitratireducens DSM 15102 TaxID=1121911 RepID=A0A1T4LF75_9FIRM|nr:flagellar assembly protein FliW [Garciella nitratireducens]SJZ53271.1 flagellar assembly factor FliW [Garciella nitratireducens DSM 15102]
MNIYTKYFGNIKIDPRKIITFPKGIPAFEKSKQYVLLEIEENDNFQCLQSIENVEVAFFLIVPWNFFPDYELNIPQEDLKELKITKIEQVALYNIVSISENLQKMTANLLAPIVINQETLQGKQVILHQENYHTKHPLLFDEKKEEV